MKTEFRLTNVGAIEASMQITMSINDWIELRNQIKDKWPGSVLAIHILNVVNKAEQTFYSYGDEDK